MAGPVITNMFGAISDRQFPAITHLNRVEGRPRARKFDSALKAEVRDALWMLSRQWQMGEFAGDDAASPFFAKMNMQATPLSRYRAGALPGESVPTDAPLEAVVERQPVPLSRGGRAIARRSRRAARPSTKSAASCRGLRTASRSPTRAPRRGCACSST